METEGTARVAVQRLPWPCAVPAAVRRGSRGGTEPAPRYILPAFLAAFLPALALFFFALALPVVFFAIASPRFKATAARVRACLQHTQLARRLQ